MNLLIKASLTVLFIISAIFLIFNSALKLLLLNSDFWIKSYEKADVYNSLAKTIKNEALNNFNRGGSDININPEILTGFITPEIIRDISEKNIINFLNFANGRSSVLNIYLASSKLPKGIIPTALLLQGDEISFSAISSFFNLNIPEYTYIRTSTIGSISTFLWIINLGIFILILGLMYKKSEIGKKLKHVGLTFILTSLVTFIMTAFSNSVKISLEQNLLNPQSEVIQKFLGILVPPIIYEINQSLVYIAAGLFLIGLVLMFTKKPGTKTIKQTH